MRKINIFSKMDKPLLIMCLVYSIIGIMMVLSASSVSAVLKYDTNPYYFFLRQLTFVLASYGLSIFIILRTPVRKYKKYVHGKVLARFLYYNR